MLEQALKEVDLPTVTDTETDLVRCWLVIDSCIKKAVNSTNNRVDTAVHNIQPSIHANALQNRLRVEAASFTVC